MSRVILIIVIFQMTNIFSQEIPCYKQKRICPRNNKLSCRNLVSYDEENQIYFVKNNFNTLYTGSCYSCYRNGVLEEIINIENGKRNTLENDKGQRIDTSYYNSGCIQSTHTIVLGAIHGKQVLFYDSTNNAREERNFFNGNSEGPHIFFKNNEKKDTIFLEHFSNNILHGAVVEFYDDSKRRKSTNYKDGLLHGKHIVYEKDGRISSTYDYFEGKKHGEWTIFYDENKIARVENWNKGLKDGIFLTANRNNDTTDIEHYLLDLKHGFFMTKSENDTSKFEIYKKDSLLYSYTKDNFHKKTIVKDLNKKSAKYIVKKKQIRKQLPNKFIDVVRSDLKNKKYKKTKKKEKKEKENKDGKTDEKKES